jgi:pyridoxamine 5'-phosphate oxidase family protein
LTSSEHEVLSSRHDFTPAELGYLRSQPLGRLATVDVDGVPQVNPVRFRITSSGNVLIGSVTLAKTRKYRNVAATGRAALVFDDLVSSSGPVMALNEG